ncbi:MAG TPA: thiamine pyrophosphate-dependent dehydrogenase E1 component subunit alpha [Candidatus Acidoferrales bacterium]|nr:thiamine pyrophosphate-dependent dehydrogenase E1 component subunit alpha [Candidatus Acidoferrales bacterium]
MDASAIPKEQLFHMYRTMVTIRRFEETIRDLFFQGQIPGFVHVSIGEEAVPTGVCAALTDKDYITTTHRGHGHMLAKGGEPKRMMAELFGRKTGYCKGKGGSMHIVSYELGILGANGIVGAGIPIATGAALASSFRGNEAVAVSFFGDGASNEGTFHESLNLASLWKLPAIYVCQNNAYAEFTATSESTSVKDIAVRAAGYDMPGVVVDGNDVLAVYEVMRQAVTRAKKGEGPTLIEAKTYRWEGHVVGEQAFVADYRDPQEIAAAKQRCPIVLFTQKLLETGFVAAAELERIQREVQATIDDAVAFAQSSPLPDVSEATQDVFANP